MVDDDTDDIYLTKRAFCGFLTNLLFHGVQNNQQLFDYLYQRSAFSDPLLYPRPDAILLDINIPKTNGYDILRNIRTDPRYSYLPVVVMSSSNAPSDIMNAYRMGANSYLTKSSSTEGMKQIAAQFCNYWFSFNTLVHQTIKTS